MITKKRKYWGWIVILSLALSLVLLPNRSLALQITSGVNHQKEQRNVSGYKQTINTMSINLSDPYTKVKIGLPNPINSLHTVSSLARKNTFTQHRVVGAINASFFHWDSRLPSYLLAKDNKIVNLGAVSTKSNNYMHTPAAFGINKAGKGQIDRFDLNVNITHNNQTFTLTDFNRARDIDESILFTSSYKFDHTRTNPYGMEVVVTGVPKRIDHDLKFGEKVTGKVKSIRPYGQTTSATIPKDGFVLSAHGAAIDQIRNLEIGDDVTISLDVEDKWKNSDFMLASGPLLVQNGKVDMTIDSNSPKVTQRAPHTAVAVDNTGDRVFFVTVDGRQPGYSRGMTLIEFAKHLVSLGADYALNLDGGGSTAMVARQHGDTYASIVNRPSDGYERSVSAILQAVNIAPAGHPNIIKAKLEKSGVVAIGASVGFSIDYVLDEYLNKIAFDTSQMKYSVEGDIGKMEDDKFVGTKAGKGYVVIQYGGAKTKVPVTVADNLANISIEPKNIRLAPGQKQELNVKAISKTGEPLTINLEGIEWTVNGSVGKVQSGHFIASDKEGKGSLVASFGKHEVIAPVEVTTDPLIIHNFNTLSNLKQEDIRASAKLELDSILQRKEGNGSGKLRYQFPTNQSGVAASYISAVNPIKIQGKPTKIGVWVYGDGQNHWLRGRIKDASGREHTLNFTGEGELNWYGWKYVEAPLPTSSITYPVSFKQIYVAEPLESNKNKGFLYFDKLQAVYSSQYEEVAFNSSSKAKVVDLNKKWTIRFNTSMSSSWINNKTIYVENIEGKRIPVDVKLVSNGKAVEVYAPSNGYESGEYRLVVTRFAKSQKNVLMTKDHITQFKVK
ncbi:phosphodiester glycosidase family protein [Bacillus seohaeanensis]|uniref:Phosphodiester glycosidase family protein n=1 Tax=Bacillus seohaeanensis TaxID=284580 RepID=A0ABW5RM91_9BACI